MTNNLLMRILLSPFAFIYGSIVQMRQLGYKMQLLRSSRFDVPTIVVGNLSTGGAGKSPHIEYLIRLLEPYINVAVLSRGYKRKTEGFRMVEPDNTALEVGDEPLQFKRKYPSVPVAVGERRAYAIPQIIYRYPDIQTILLDDAFQHLAVQPYKNVLITEYKRPYTKDYLLPVGNLREWRDGAMRADIIVVSKCPIDMQTTEKQQFIRDIQPLEHQKVFFSYYDYGAPYHIFTPSVKTEIDAETDVLLVTGIARVDYLVEHLSKRVKSVTTLAFEDHRVFTNYDVAHVKTLFDQMQGRKKVILTTEKDATRLELHKPYIADNQLNIFAIPVEVKFLFGEQEAFDNTIKNALLDFKI
ncbi:MAG: tetraacyldisaccharide 4'-kinase [Saprospiraceae bacterium]|nr:tetraacyldisaccharide 4'-kinase [Saprospiraceae bacterium]